MRYRNAVFETTAQNVQLCKEVDTTKLCRTGIQLGYLFLQPIALFRIYIESVGILNIHNVI